MEKKRTMIDLFSRSQKRWFLLGAMVFFGIAALFSGVLISGVLLQAGRFFTLHSAATATAAPVTMLASSQSAQQVHYVATDGSDDTGDGSIWTPWATITYAVTQATDGDTILVRPGWYEQQVVLQGSFARGLTIRAEVPYRTQLRYNEEQVIICFNAQGITVEGFDIAHIGPGAGIYVVQIQDSLGGAHGGDYFVNRIVLRNNILHDSYNNDIVKINNGAGQILIEGNMFYNQQGLESHLDINSVTDVIVQDNIFYNDFAGSGRVNRNDTGSYIVIKDSNSTADTNLGALNIRVRRNIFLQWEGDEDNTFVVIGEDDVEYYQAQDVVLENNLFLGNSENRMRAAFQVRGARDVLFRNNTVVGDLPSKAYAFRLSRGPGNQPNRDIYFYNNIWSDPTGTMGREDPTDWVSLDFSDTPAAATNSFVLQNNLYWNGQRSIPIGSNELINLDDDSAALVGDPHLPAQETLVVPRWDPERGTFVDGSATIRDVFVRLVHAYGVPAGQSPAIGAADPTQIPVDDILGMPRRRQQPTIGAVEQVLLAEAGNE